MREEDSRPFPESTMLGLTLIAAIALAPSYQSSCSASEPDVCYCRLGGGGGATARRGAATGWARGAPTDWGSIFRLKLLAPSLRSDSMRRPSSRKVADFCL